MCINMSVVQTKGNQNLISAESIWNPYDEISILVSEVKWLGPHGRLMASLLHMTQSTYHTLTPRRRINECDSSSVIKLGALWFISIFGQRLESSEGWSAFNCRCARKTKNVGAARQKFTCASALWAMPPHAESAEKRQQNIIFNRATTALDISIIVGPHRVLQSCSWGRNAGKRVREPMCFVPL